MAAKYGYDISGPATTAQGSDSVDLLLFTWLPWKSQNGAAMSFGRTSSFLDIYIERA